MCRNATIFNVWLTEFHDFFFLFLVVQVDATLLLPVAMYYLGFPVILLFLCTTLEATSTGLWSKLDFVNGFFLF